MKFQWQQTNIHQQEKIQSKNSVISEKITLLIAQKEQINMTKPNSKVKRKLLDELNGESSASCSKRAKAVKSANQQGKKQIVSVRNLQKVNTDKRKVKLTFENKERGDNNNAMPSKLKIQVKAKPKTLNRSSSSGKTKTPPVIPIIQTRKMKANALKNSFQSAPLISQNEIDKIVSIDKLASSEIADGDRVLNDSDNIFHDGVEITILGSDIEDDEFPETIQQNAENSSPHTTEDSSSHMSDSRCEPGELSSSDEGEDTMTHQSPPRPKVASKIVNVNKGNTRMDKFAHLKNDPDFKDFLKEWVDERVNEKLPRKAGESSVDNRDNSERRARSKSQGQRKTKGTPIQLSQEAVSPMFNRSNTPITPALKSPSDTTIYSPGLRKVNNEDVALIEKISHFVKSIRIDEKRERGFNSNSKRDTPDQHTPLATDTRHVEHAGQQNGSSSRSRGHGSAIVRQQSARPSPNKQPDTMTEQLLLQAEKFRARIEAPKGNQNQCFSDLLMPYDYDKSALSLSDLRDWHPLIVKSCF